MPGQHSRPRLHPDTANGYAAACTYNDVGRPVDDASAEEAFEVARREMGTVDKRSFMAGWSARAAACALHPQPMVGARATSSCCPTAGTELNSARSTSSADTGCNDRTIALA
jgi:hypothetical protein